MRLENRITAFAELGKFLSQFSTANPKPHDDVLKNDVFFESFKQQMLEAENNNKWFTVSNLNFCFKNWSKLINNKDLNNWIKSYTLNDSTSKKVAIIMAGNIPLVGFHDFLSVLLCGHSAIVKLSSNDKCILPFLATYLQAIEPKFKHKIEFTSQKLTDFDAVIATGSSNTARYFEYYFKNKPSIIRKSRNSVAVLSGNETHEELKALSEDIFRYFGLGCRSVSKLFVPKNYNFDAFFEAIYHWHPLIENAKYANNYDYNKAVYLMSEFNLLENGFLMLKEDVNYASPIATLFYEYYDDVKVLKQRLKTDNTYLQCVVSNLDIENSIPFGTTQQPKLNDYADGIDTVDFLLKI